MRDERHGLAGAQARGPEIIVVNDRQADRAVEGQGGGALRAVKIGALIVVPLILGFVLGGINYDRKRFNNTLDDSKAMTEEFKQIGKALESLNVAMLNAKDRGRGGFALWDKDLVAEVDALTRHLDEGKVDRLLREPYSLDSKLRLISQVIGPVKTARSAAQDQRGTPRHRAEDPRLGGANA